MTQIRVFVNLKRFDVPRPMGGVCPTEAPGEWISGIVERSIALNLGAGRDLELTYLLPEGLLVPALATLDGVDAERRSALSLGCQGVYREDVSPGGNFGAFTTNLPAAAAVNLGCTWSMIGHSEERRDKLGVIEAFRVGASTDPEAQAAVDRLIGDEVSCALRAGLSVLLCIGETEPQRSQIDEVLERQLTLALGDHSDAVAAGRVVIGYEPIWAIGPGKTPPEADEIAHIATQIKKLMADNLGVSAPVVYGGGLKKENAEAIGAQSSVDGGLVALTRFSGEIGFDPDGLAEIITHYRKGVAR